MSPVAYHIYSFLSIGAGRFLFIGAVRHVTGTGSGLLGGIPRVVVQISALTLKGPLLVYAHPMLSGKTPV